MALKIAILGASGQLGQECVEFFRKKHRVFSFSRKELDVTDLNSVLRKIKEVSPDIIINTSAYTDVDMCEVYRERAFLVNALGARNVAISSEEVGAKLFHISTDYVFDGRKNGPYREYDVPNPINVYGKSKLLGEEMVSRHCRRFFILRVSWLYSVRGKNFVKTIIKLASERGELKVVDDQMGTPTFCGDVVRQIELLMETESYGVYHSSSQGSCTWYEFAKRILDLCGISAVVVPVRSDEFPSKARRPENSVLDNFLLRIQGLDIMPHWEESLGREIGKIKREVLGK